MKHINIVNKKDRYGKMNRASVGRYVSNDYKKLYHNDILQVHMHNIVYFASSMQRKDIFNTLYTKLNELFEYERDNFCTENSTVSSYASRSRIVLNMEKRIEVVFYMFKLLALQPNLSEYDSDNSACMCSMLSRKMNFGKAETEMFRTAVLLELLDMCIEDIYDCILREDIEDKILNASVKIHTQEMFETILSDPRELFLYIKNTIRNISCIDACDNLTSDMLSNAKHAVQLIDDLIVYYTLLARRDRNIIIENNKRKIGAKQNLFGKHLAQKRAWEPQINALVNELLEYYTYGKLADRLFNIPVPMNDRRTFICGLGRSYVLITNIWFIFCSIIFDECLNFCLEKINERHDTDSLLDVIAKQQELAYNPGKLLDQHNAKHHAEALIMGVPVDDMFI